MIRALTRIWSNAHQSKVLKEVDHTVARVLEFRELLPGMMMRSIETCRDQGARRVRTQQKIDTSYMVLESSL